MDNDLLHSNNLEAPALSHTALQLNGHLYLGRTRAQGLLAEDNIQLGGRHQGVVCEGAGGRGEDPGRRYEGPGTERRVGRVETV